MPAPIEYERLHEKALTPVIMHAPSERLVTMAEVVLGSQAYLHTGIHGSLRQSPPPSVTYVVSHAIHTLILPTPNATPFPAQSFMECVDFAPEARAVHSAFWPVLPSPTRLAQADDLGVALFCSHYAF